MLMKSVSCDKGAAAAKEFGFIGVAQEILETIGDGFCAIDGEWNIVHVNLRACEMWGIGDGQVDRPRLLERLPTNDRHGCREASPRRDQGWQQGRVRGNFADPRALAVGTRLPDVKRPNWPLLAGHFGPKERGSSAPRERGEVPTGFRAKSARNGDCGSRGSLPRGEPCVVAHARVCGGGPDRAVLPRHCSSR